MPPLEYPCWDDKRLFWDMPGLRFDCPLPSYITHPPQIKKGTKPMSTKKQATLISQAEKAADGLHQLDGIVTLVHNPEAGLRADIAAITDGIQQEKVAKEKLDAAYDLLHTAIKNSNKFLVKAAKALRLSLGDKPSATWAEAGWSARSLETPAAEELLLPHLNSLKLFLTSHPERETTVGDLTLTAANCAALHKTLSDARSGDSTNTNPNDPNRIWGVDWHQSNYDDKQGVLVLTEKALVNRMRDLRSEFDQVVNDPDSPHYLTMGFARPGDATAPGATENTSATALGNAAVRIQCDAVSGADHYIFRGKIIGVDNKPRYLGSSSNPDYIAEGLPVGKTVEVQVVAANANGDQGPAGPVAQVVVT
ncbi:MAG: hypothetical protein NT105_18795 [Verrucomicrobia bacterium]|nr:hypothetical protein [Verrucomicrobiota bacterium]